MCLSQSWKCMKVPERTSQILGDHELYLLYRLTSRATFCGESSLQVPYQAKNAIESCLTSDAERSGVHQIIYDTCKQRVCKLRRDVFTQILVIKAPSAPDRQRILVLPPASAPQRQCSAALTALNGRSHEVNRQERPGS